MKLSQLPVGALVKDIGSTYLGEHPIFRVLEHGHTGDPAGSTTLDFRDIICLKAFDAKEPNNTDSSRKNYGNNRYLHSNILQWLNSTAAGGSWYTAQHTYDQAPTPKSYTANYNEYASEAGFLSFMSAQFRAALKTVSKTTAKNTVTDGGGSEAVSSKIFLLSTTEVGLANEGSVAEGSVYSYYSSGGHNGRKKNLMNDAAKGDYTSATSPWYWWLRTPHASTSYGVRAVYTNGALNYDTAYYGYLGVAPAFCVSSDLVVSDEPGADGVYTIKWGPSVSKIYIGDNNGEAKEIYSAAPTYRTMTVEINLADSNLDTWATYKDDAVNMTVGGDEWDEFFGHYPCVLNNGAELGKIKTSDFTKYEDGTSIPTALGNDVMIAFPRRGIKISTSGNILTISMTDEDNVDGYSYMAHSYKGSRCDKFYLGAYKGYISSSQLYSSSGKTPSANITIGNFRTYAQARGTGYEQSAFYQLTYRQVMYMLKYKGQNAQIAVGRGFVDGNSAIYGATGYTNSRGMDWGETTGKYPMTLFGLEDFWGNIYEYIDGIYSNSNRQLSVADGSYNDTGSGYTDAGTSSFSSNISGYMKTTNGTSIAGFTPAATTYGSDSTYFCDAAIVNAGRLACFGGYWSDASSAGVFRLSVSQTASTSSASIGSRLMYMHVES